MPGLARIAAVALVITVVAAPALAAPALAAAPQTAEATLRRHLDGMDDGVTVAGGFEAGFVKLDHENMTLFDGLDVLDADPVCQCQDSGGHYHFVGHAEGPDRYIATVRAEGEKDTWQVIMRKIGAAWTFYDVIDSRGSVRALLMRHNACARATLAKGLSLDACADLR